MRDTCEPSFSVTNHHLALLDGFVSWSETVASPVLRQSKQIQKPPLCSVSFACEFFAQKAAGGCVHEFPKFGGAESVKERLICSA